MTKIPLIAIIGPTATGKTEFSLRLAAALSAEIISVDSRQVYKYLDVGTDKIDLEIRAEIPHHLIDIVYPNEIYSAADFAKDASLAVSKIMSKGKVPLLVGGTPFYYKALCGSLSPDLPKDIKTRQELEREFKERGNVVMHEELASLDKESASKIHPNDNVRIMRALEIYRLTGRPASWWYYNQDRASSCYEILYIGLTKDRKELYTNIERRVKMQFASGYPEEVKWLLDNGYSPTLPALQGFGYKELVLYIQGKCSLIQAIEGDIRSTKIFSRRQMTWFKHFEPAVWYDLSTVSTDYAFNDALPKCLKHIAGI